MKDDSAKQGDDAHNADQSQAAPGIAGQDQRATGAARFSDGQKDAQTAKESNLYRF